MATLRQIAHIAGVSHTTVALALRDDPEIKPATREKIKEIARRLNYTLPAWRSEPAFGKTVGYIIHSPFGILATNFLRGVMEEASEERIGVTLMQVPMNREWIEETILHLLSMRVNGLIIGHAFTKFLTRQSLLACWSNGVHVVQVMNRVFMDPVDSVVRHEVEYARAAANHLAALGHRLVLALHIPEADKWEAIFRERGMELVYIIDAHEISELLQAFDMYLGMNPRPTAIVSMMDDDAFFIINLARTHGIDVPGDLSVLGVGNAVPAQYVYVSTVDIQAHEMGRLGMKVLNDRIRAGVPPHEITEFKNIVLPANVIDRGSTGPARVATPGRRIIRPSHAWGLELNQGTSIPYPDWREARRFRAYELSKRGWSQNAIAKELNISQSAVSKWLTIADHNPNALRAHPRPGAYPRLNAEQYAVLHTLLAQGAKASSFPTNTWTGPRLATLIARRFNVQLSERQCRRLLVEFRARMG